MKWLVIVFFLYTTQVHAQQRCQDLFKKNNADSSIDFEQGMERLKQGFAELDPNMFKATPDEIKNFNRSDSSYRTLDTAERRVTITNLFFWKIVVDRIFIHPSLETKERIQKTKYFFDQFDSIFKNLPNLSELTIQSRKTKWERSSKITMIQVLKMQSHWLSIFLHKKINLLKQQDVLDLYGASTRNDLQEKMLTSYAEYEKFLRRIAPFLEESKRFAGDIIRELNLHFFNDPEAKAFSIQDRGFFQRHAHYEEVVSLLRALRLPARSFELYLRDAEVIRRYFGGAPESLRDSHRFLALILLKAAEEAYNGRRMGIGASWFRRGYFYTGTYSALKNQIEASEIVRAIVEEKMADYVNASDAFNQRWQQILEQLEHLEATTPETQDTVEALRASLAELEVKDFGVDLRQRGEDLFWIESQLDSIREILANKKKNDGIKNFSELNNRWYRLVPDKIYSVSGIDYQGVSFSQEVIDFFANNPVLGSRYLAAFSKSYVAILGDSGLRRLPSIHADMRDIKIIRSHGKVRIVGRLLNGTIHFFYIYASEKPYENQRMRQIVDHFQ